MSRLITILAHATETHENVVEATAHGMPWFVQIPLTLAAIAAAFAILYKITKKLDLTILIISGILLLVGFGFYSAAPIVSVISITIGLVATLLVTLLGLGSS